MTTYKIETIEYVKLKFKDGKERTIDNKECRIDNVAVNDGRYDFAVYTEDKYCMSEHRFNRFNIEEVRVKFSDKEEITIIKKEG